MEAAAYTETPWVSSKLNSVNILIHSIVNGHRWNKLKRTQNFCPKGKGNMSHRNGDTWLPNCTAARSNRQYLHVRSQDKAKVK
jgi:hypothetical protein